MIETYCIVTFDITQHALIFEKILKENGLGIKLMPAPRQLSASCGTAAYVTCEEKEEILKLCNENNIPIDTFHEMEVDNNGSWFLKHLKR